MGKEVVNPPPRYTDWICILQEALMRHFILTKEPAPHLSISLLIPKREINRPMGQTKHVTFDCYLVHKVKNNPTKYLPTCQRLVKNFLFRPHLVLLSRSIILFVLEEGERSHLCFLLGWQMAYIPISFKCIHISSFNIPTAHLYKLRENGWRWFKRSETAFPLRCHMTRLFLMMLAADPSWTSFQSTLTVQTFDGIWWSCWSLLLVKRAHAHE